MREGQFWIVLGFGLAIAMSTLLDGSPRQCGALNAAFVGLVLVLTPGLELAGLRRGMDMVQAALGLWLAFAPFVLAYTDSAHIAIVHIVLGLLLALLGAYRLLQGWRANLRQEH